MPLPPNVVGELENSLQSLLPAINLLAENEGDPPASLIEALNICSNRVDSLMEAVKALADKLDAEDVTGLDTDYRTTIDSNLI